MNHFGHSVQVGAGLNAIVSESVGDAGDGVAEWSLLSGKSSDALDSAGDILGAASVTADCPEPGVTHAGKISMNCWVDFISLIPGVGPVIYYPQKTNIVYNPNAQIESSLKSGVGASW